MSAHPRRHYFGVAGAFALCGAWSWADYEAAIKAGRRAPMPSTTTDRRAVTCLACRRLLGEPDRAAPPPEGSDATPSPTSLPERIDHE